VNHHALLNELLETLDFLIQKATQPFLFDILSLLFDHPMILTNLLHFLFVEFLLMCQRA
jgi:hypothetical protein